MPNHLRPQLLALALFCFTALVAALLFGSPEPLQQSLSAKAILGAFCWFIVFLGSLLGWGSLLSRKEWGFPQGILTKLLLGSFFLVGCMVLASFFGILGDRFRYLYLAILLLGTTGVALPHFKLHREPAFWIALVAAALLLGILFSGATAPNLFQDVLNYHLLGPWRWWMAGRASFDPSFPHLYLASYWDYLNLWPIALMGSSGSALFASLFFSQWLHVLLGVGGSMLAIFAILRQSRIRPEWSLVAAIAGVMIFPLLWAAWLAKNDFGALFFFLGSLYFLQEKKPALAGFAAGFAFAAKFSMIFGIFFAPLVAFYLSPRKKELLFFGIFFLLGASPILLRNWAGSGNPFFPLFLDHFPAAASASMRMFSYDSLGSVDLAANLANFFPLFLSVSLREPAIFISLGMLAFSVWKNQGIFLPLLAILSLCLPLLWLGRTVEDFLHLRYLAPALCLATILAVSLLSRWKALEQSKPLNAAAIFLALAFLLFSKPYFSPRDLAFLEGRPDSYEILVGRTDGGHCKAWMAENLPAESRILSLEDDSLFLLPQPNIKVAFHDPAIDPILRTERDPVKLLEKFRAIGIQYVFSATHRAGNHYYLNSKEIFTWLTTQNPVKAAADCVVVGI